MIEQEKKTSVYILAGGKSSRMGQDKGLMTISGKPVIQYIIEQILLLTENLTIISNNPEYEKLGILVIPDLIKDIGPAGGIYTALNHSRSESNFIVSCDMPLISSLALKYILENVDDFQITLPIHQEKIEPLFGVYNKSCLPLWKQLIDEGLTKLQLMVNHFKLRKLNVDNHELFNEDLFTNINTITEFEKLVSDKIKK